MRRVLSLLLLAAPLLAADDYAALLGRVVQRDGVDYNALKKGRAALDAYVKALADASPGRADTEKIAFWINAYNGAHASAGAGHGP